jgi:acyl carrier protein
LKKRMPFADFSDFDKNPTVENAQKLLNVQTVVNYIQSKLG